MRARIRGGGNTGARWCQLPARSAHARAATTPGRPRRSAARLRVRGPKTREASSLRKRSRWLPARAPARRAAPRRTSATQGLDAARRPCGLSVSRARSYPPPFRHAWSAPAAARRAAPPIGAQHPPASPAAFHGFAFAARGAATPPLSPACQPVTHGATAELPRAPLRRFFRVPCHPQHTHVLVKKKVKRKKRPKNADRRRGAGGERAIRTHRPRDGRSRLCFVAGRERYFTAPAGTQRAERVSQAGRQYCELGSFHGRATSNGRAGGVTGGADWEEDPGIDRWNEPGRGEKKKRARGAAARGGWIGAQGPRRAARPRAALARARSLGHGSM